MSELQPHTVSAGRSRLVAYDHGATLASWHLGGREVIWLSPQAVLDGTSAIRGGVPICFPWFAAGPAGDLSPSHGLVRTATWTPAETQGEKVLAWTLRSEDLLDRDGADHLPGEFAARYSVSLHGDDLGILLEVHNPGATVYRVEAALHTYLAVADLDRVEVLGLDGAPYLDKVSGTREVQDGPLRFHGETDNVYDSVGDPGPVLLDGAGGRVELVTEGATQTVVWNPGAAISARTGDLGVDAYRDFVCVETAATAAHALEVPAHGTVRLGCRFVVHPRVGGMTR